MPAQTVARRPLALLCLALAPLTLAACGSTVSTSNFKGEQHAAAQAIADLQADATAGEQKKICKNDLSASVVAKLGGKKGCEKTIKTQLTEIDSLEVSVQSVQIAAGGKTAIAHVKSTYAGKKRAGTVSLAKESAGWRITATS
jgi:copper chaperone CopZ